MLMPRECEYGGEWFDSPTGKPYKARSCALVDAATGRHTIHVPDYKCAKCSGKDEAGGYVARVIRGGLRSAIFEYRCHTLAAITLDEAVERLKARVGEGELADTLVEAVASYHMPEDVAADLADTHLSVQQGHL